MRRRAALATQRLVRNLEALGVANARTLEMKISDSGPMGQRINPHVLTKVRNDLVKAGHLVKVEGQWFHRQNEKKDRVDERLALLKPLYAETVNGSFTRRMGQTLEIAIHQALEKGHMEFLGGFLDLDAHDDSSMYSKEEPPLRFSGKKMPGDKRFDFLGFHPTAGTIGIEAKNVREWLYPNRAEIKDLLLKAVVSDSLPVLIARRVPYVTRRLLESCGVMIFETYNQLYPYADADLAARVLQKDLLGYHDVRIGNEPSPQLIQFLTKTLPDEAEDFRDRFEKYKDLLTGFADGSLYYASFAARVRRREDGTSEDSDGEPEGEDPDDYYEPGE